MAYPKHVWSQLKNITCERLIRALKADGWEEDVNMGATIAFVKGNPPERRVVVHYHPKKTYGAKLLKALLDDTGWSQDDFKRLRLIK